MLSLLIFFVRFCFLVLFRITGAVTHSFSPSFFSSKTIGSCSHHPKNQQQSSFSSSSSSSMIHQQAATCFFCFLVQFLGSNKIFASRERCSSSPARKSPVGPRPQNQPNLSLSTVPVRFANVQLVQLVPRAEIDESPFKYKSRYRL